MRYIGGLLGACAALAMFLSADAAYAACQQATISNPNPPPCLTPPTDVSLGALTGQSSRPLRDSLDRRLDKLRQKDAGAPTEEASVGSIQYASTDIAAAAGEARPISNLWAALGHGWLDSDSTTVNFRGHQDVGTIGFDHAVLPNLTLGLATSVDKIFLEVRNTGGQAEVENITLIPYARWGFADSFSLEAAGGITRSHISQDGNTVHADTHAWRRMLSGALNHNRLFGTWIVGGRVGTLFVWEATESFTDSVGNTFDARYNTLGQMQAGANVGRIFEWGGINLSATYLYDFNRFVTFDAQGNAIPAPDRDGINVAVSAYTPIASQLNLEFNVTHEFFRSHTNNTFLTGRLAYSF
jgi:hypothetical protein